MVMLHFQVDTEIAQAFESSLPEEQKKIQALINQWLRQALKISILQNTMDRLSDEAKLNGLTPEILQSIINE